jgi:hypothetical protein
MTRQNHQCRNKQMRICIAFLLCVLMAPPTVWAEDAERPGAIIGRWHSSEDTDDFRSRRAALGYLWGSGWGMEARISHFSAPGWSADGKTLSGVYQSRSADSSISARLGLDETKGASTGVGMFDYMRNVTRETALGVSAERDVVDSVNSINNHIRYTAGALVLDHAFSDRANVGMSAGNIWYSDGNQRRQLRTRWNYELIERSGLNAYAKTRHFRNTQPYNGYYFAPEDAAEYSAGLSWRTAVSESAVLQLQGDAGRQFIDGEPKGLWTVLIGLQSHHRARTQWRVAFEVRNDASSNRNLGDEDYRYMMLTGNLIFPLQ